MKTAVLSELGQRTGPPPISWLMQLTLSHPKLVSLAAGFTDNASLPVAEVRACLEEVLCAAKTGQRALQYGTAQGDPALRHLTAERLRKLDPEEVSTDATSRSDRRRTMESPHVVSHKAEHEASPAYSPDRMLITNGSQQLLYMVSEALCSPGDIMLVEDPTYFVYLGIVQSHGLRARGVRMQPDGLDLAHLESVLESLKRRGDLKRVKALYLVSYFQNPTGITTSLAKKAGALKLLRQYERVAGHPIYLIEDAAYRELRFRGVNVPSALTLKDAADRVVYAGTYSKPFATGARVGFGILPEPLFTAVLRIKGNHDFGTSNLLQQLLARGLASGRYERHLCDLKMRYARKAETMRRALLRNFPSVVEWLEPEGGLYFWAHIPGGMKSGVKSKLFKTALERNVLYVPGALCYADDATRTKPDSELRLSYGGATERDIREGIRRLGGVLHEFLDG